jgi:hypothetical protein
VGPFGETLGVDAKISVLDQSARSAQPEGRHVDVHILVGARLDHIGLMPDADRAIGAHRLVEKLPCRQVGQIARLGIGQQVIHAAPVLQEDGELSVHAGSHSFLVHHGRLLSVGRFKQQPRCGFN